MNNTKISQESRPMLLFAIGKHINLKFHTLTNIIKMKTMKACQFMKGWFDGLTSRW